MTASAFREPLRVRRDRSRVTHVLDVDRAEHRPDVTGEAERGFAQRRTVVDEGDAGPVPRRHRRRRAGRQPTARRRCVLMRQCAPGKRPTARIPYRAGRPAGERERSSTAGRRRCVCPSVRRSSVAMMAIRELNASRRRSTRSEGDVRLSLRRDAGSARRSRAATRTACRPGPRARIDDARRKGSRGRVSRGAPLRGGREGTVSGVPRKMSSRRRKRDSSAPRGRRRSTSPASAA
jgi:hypothetical protein